MIRILSLLQVIDLERLLDAVELNLLDMLHRDFEFDRRDPGVSNMV
jgi:hypothetical protein